MGGSAGPRVCICGSSSRLPLCDGAHRAEGWRCGSPGSERFADAFVADHAYANLADRLAHRFDGVSLHRVDGQIRCGRLVVITAGHGGPTLAGQLARVSTEHLVVLGVGVPEESLRWAFPEASVVAMIDDAGVGLWTSAEAALATPTGVEPSPQRPSVFLSHAHQDEGQLFAVIEALRTRFHLDIFVCADSIPDGSEWSHEIEAQLRERSLFVSVASQAALASTFCAFEAGMAVALNKPIRVVSLDGVRPASHLQHLQALDITRLRSRKPWLSETEATLEAFLQVCADAASDRAAG